MRIALVSHEYPPFRGGGIGTYATVMSRLLAEAGHETHVVTNRFSFGSADPLHEREVHRDGNLWVHRIDALTDDWGPKLGQGQAGGLYADLYNHWSPYLYYAELVSQELERICGEHGIDVIEFPECAAEGYMAMRRRRCGLAFRDQAMTVTLHSPIYEIYQYNLYSKYNLGFQTRTMMEEYTIRHADAVNSPSRLLAEIVYRRLGLEAGRPPCDVIPLPMDFDRLPAVAAGQRDEGDGPSLLFVGRLEPRKGVRYLVDAAVRVMQRHPGLRVYLVGRDCDAGEAPGTMTDFLRSRIPSPLRPRFIFTGQMTREELFSRYGQVTACVFAAPWDNFPLTCVEAMSCGACVIASDYTGMAEMIEHERSGLLFKACSIDSLAAAIERVINDPALASRMRSAAPARIRQVCDPLAAVENRVAHYQRTIEQHRSRLPVVSGNGARPSRSVAVLMPEGRPVDEALQTLSDLKASADHARVDLRVTVPAPASGGSGRDAIRALSFVEVVPSEGRPGNIRVLSAWLEKLGRHPPDFLMTVHAGDRLQPSLLEGLLGMFGEPAVAWSAAWAVPVAGRSGVRYAGFDFSAPLEIMGYHPVPMPLIRYSAFRQVGGWNLDLPPGWRSWDLFLAFEQAGLEGRVLPCWLGRFVPHPDDLLGKPDSSEMMTQILEKIADRNADLFARHGRVLWLYRTLNSLSTSAPDPSVSTGSNGHCWEDWRQVTRVCLKTSFPRAAHAYRKYVKKQG